MADDVFNITNIESAKEAMLAMQGATTRTAEQIHDMELAIRTFGEVSARLPELALLDPSKFKDVRSMLAELTKELIRQGKTVRELNAIRKQEKQLIGAELVDMAKLTREARKRIKEEKKKLDFGEKYVRLGDKVMKLQAGEVKGVKKTLSAFGEKGTQLAKYASSMAGVQLSLAGIIALILELWNIERKAGAMAKQITVQWADSADNIRVATQEMSAIRYEFHKAWEIAGQYEISLARAGFEKKNLELLSRKLYATELLMGRSVQQQQQDIAGLVTTFGIADSEADNYLDTVRAVAKTVPMLSMDQAVEDWEFLVNETKAYNTDLLGTLSLYNTLMRVDLADKLGLGDAPRVIRHEIIKTVAGFSKNLSDGWKVALGKGSTAAIAMLEFEALPIEKQFLRMAKKVEEQTRAYPDKERQVRARKLLMQMNFPIEAATELARAFAKNAFDPKALASLATTMREQKDAAKAAEEKARADREALIAEGLSIAYGLTDALTLLKDWLEGTLLPIFRDIRDYLKEHFGESEVGKSRRARGEREEIATKAERQFLKASEQDKITAALAKAPGMEAYVKSARQYYKATGELIGVEPERKEKLIRRKAAEEYRITAAGKAKPGELEKALEDIVEGSADRGAAKVINWVNQANRNQKAVKRNSEGKAGHTTRKPKDKHFKYVIKG